MLKAMLIQTRSVTLLDLIASILHTKIFLRQRVRLSFYVKKLAEKAADLNLLQNTL